MFRFATAAAAALLAATSAGAVTTVTVNSIDYGFTLPSGLSALYNFDADSPNVILGPNAGYFFGNTPGVAAAPAFSPTTADTTRFLAVGGGGTATINLGVAARQISIYWGSIDTYNTIQLFNGSTLVDTFTGGSDLGPTVDADGNQVLGSSNRRVFFNVTGGSVDRLVLSSSQNAFEISDVAVSAIPEPSTWAMMILGFGMVGFAMRRRNTLRTVAA